MTTEPPRDTDPNQDSRMALITTLLVTIIVACTVFGAVLLATQGQANPDQLTVDLIPTAALATPPPITVIPTAPIVIQNAPANKASPTTATEPTPTSTERSDEATETPSPTATAPATPTAFRPTAPRPSATALQCADSPPADWQPYTVQSGDTLFGLSTRHGTTMQIVSYNNCLTSRELQVGQQLYLPPLTATPPSATVAATPTPTPSPAPTQGSPTPPQPTLTAIPTLTAPPTLPTATVIATIPPTDAPTTTPTTPTAPPEPSTPTLEPTASAPPSATPGASPTPVPTSEPTNTPPPGNLSAPAP